MKNNSYIKRGGAFALVELMVVIAFIALLAALFIPQQAKAAASAAPGQLQTVIPAGTITNVNVLSPGATYNYNLPGWTTNTVGYSTANSNAPVFYANGARQLAYTENMNLLASNAWGEVTTWYVSNDNKNWMTASSVGLTGSVTFTNQNTAYASTNLFVCGTNIDTGGFALWAIGSVQTTGTGTVSSNKTAQAYTKNGGL